MKRLWERDATLWTGSDESNWLGWLDIVEEQTAQHDQLLKLAKEVQTRGFEHILLLGMGGSSLCPEVLRMTIGRIPHFLGCMQLDSTDPAQVKAFEHQIDVAKDDTFYRFQQIGQHARFRTSSSSISSRGRSRQSVP